MTPGPEKPENTQPRKPSRPTRRRKASRAPIIDLEATEIEETATAPQQPQEPQQQEQSAAEPAEADVAGGGASDESTAAPAAENAATGPDTGDNAAGAGVTPENESRGDDARDWPHRVLVAAVAGGLTAAVLLGVLHLAGLTGGSPDAAAVAERASLEARIGELERAISTAPTGADGELATRLAVLERAVEEAATSRTDAASGSTEAVSGRLDQLEAALAETRNAARSATEGLQKIEAAVREIGSRPADEGSASSTAALELKIANLAQRLDRMAQDQVAPTGDESTVAARLDDQAQTLSRLQASVAEVAEGLAAATRRVAALPEAADPAEVDALRDTLTERLDAIEARLGKPGETRGAAAAIALASLRRAVDDGRSFAAELAAFRALVPDDPLIDVLAPHAATGLKTRTALAEAFPGIVRTAQGDAAPEADDGLGARIMARLNSVVRIRRTGEAEGASPDAVLARMAAEVRQGDLVAALKEAEVADAAVPEGVEAWIASVRARLAAEKAIEAADARMIAALGRSGG